MSFKKNKYKVLKDFVSKEMCFFLTHYFILKRSVAHKFYADYKGSPLPAPLLHFAGRFADEQIKGGVGPYVSYGDVAFDTLLELLRPHVEKAAGTKLIPTYTYARVYTKGNILPRHKDRKSCEISSTLNPFEGNMCVQVFLHYNPDTKKNRKNLYDGRFHLGLPAQKG